MGLGGKTFSNLHALETARLFDMMTPKEILAEERVFLQNLTVENCLFEDTTVLNLYTLVGMVPEKKQEMLECIDFLLR